MGKARFLQVALNPAGKNVSTNGTKYPSGNHDVLNEALG
jgi:hypothetical protein